MENATPMLRQYLEIKKQYPGTLLFFRLGDFYELFNEDAVVGSRELQITLTARHKDSARPIPMCGVPHHAASTYIAKLVRKGYRVAICEQAEASGKGVKLVKREVVRVITPGTAIDPQLIEANESVYLAAVFADADSAGLAMLDVSSGEFLATQAEGVGRWEKIREQVERFSPRELLVSEKLAREVSENLTILAKNGLLPMRDETPELVDRFELSGNTSGRLTIVDPEMFEVASAEMSLKEHFGVSELGGFGLNGKRGAIAAAGACLKYAKHTQRAAISHVSFVQYFESNEFMVLDAVTLRNLEVIRPLMDSGKNSLLSIVDETVTSMGARLLRSWILKPSIKRSEIQSRQAAVSELADPVLRDKLRFLIKKLSDLERLIGRLNLGGASPRDIIALNKSIEQAPKIKAELADASSLLIQVLAENIFELKEIRELIEKAITEEPPASVSDSGVIKAGFNHELDELRNIEQTIKQKIVSYEENERIRSGIGNLKVRFNGVFGYYVEVSKGNISRVPDDYERRQTLANAERFTTPQLKEWEEKVLGAEEKIIALETSLFNEVIAAVKNETQRLQTTARAFAMLDCLCALAETAAKRNYVCPLLHEGDEIEIKNGRHPIVEASLKDSFVSNDTYLNNSSDRLLIITGANMGGKSTILRQIALIQILAQIGSYVPATSARLPIIDRIWTRVGASDDLASGRSTFMVEMTETAAILHNATPRSLILLDEIGRGTSTFDGLSIAWAVAEYLHNSPEHSAKTMFATHYHELTELAENLPGARNYKLSATEKDGDVVFLHKLEQGKASKSYGIAVARLAGLPAVVIERAKAVLEKLEEYELAVFAGEKKAGLGAAAGRSAASQFSLFAVSNESAIDNLRLAETNKMSDAELREFISALKSKIV